MTKNSSRKLIPKLPREGFLGEWMALLAGALMVGGGVLLFLLLFEMPLEEKRYFPSSLKKVHPLYKLRALLSSFGLVVAGLINLLQYSSQRRLGYRQRVFFFGMVLVIQLLQSYIWHTAYLSSLISRGLFYQLWPSFWLYPLLLIGTTPLVVIFFGHITDRYL